MADEPQAPKDEWLSPTPAGNTGAPRDEWLSPNPSVADHVTDAAWSLPAAINRGVDNTLNLIGLPARALANAFGANIPEARILSRANADRHPTTATGRYADAVGETIGSSIIPSAGLVGNAARLAAMAPTSVPRALGQTVGQTIANAPRAAVAADVVAATGAGLAQQGAEDLGFGAGNQALAGLAGAMVPFVPGAAISGTRRAINSARASSDPHARVAAGLGDQSIDDLTRSAATGFTGIDETNAQRAMTYLGEEMVRHGGNRTAATQATLRRLENELGVIPATAREHLRRITQAQADNELMLGEYPSVAASNTDTRLARNLANVADTEAGRIEDSGVHWLTDYIANAGTGASGQRVRNAIMTRMEALREQMNARLQAMSPNGQTIQDADNLIENARRQAQRDYDAVYNGPNGTAVNYGVLHGLLPRIAERHLSRMRGRGDDQAEALREAVNRLYTEIPTTPRGVGGVDTVMSPDLPHLPTNVPANAPGMIPALQDDLSHARALIREARRQGVPKQEINEMSRFADGMAEALRLARRGANPDTQQIIMPSLQMLQDMRGGIRGQIEAARRAGRDDIANVLQPLYRDITRAMERASPQWRTANRRWADMNLQQMGEELGAAFAERAGPRFREQMTDFRALAPEAQDIVRIHFVQKLMDKVANAGDTHDLAKLFSTPHIREMVRTVLGDAAAVDLARLVRDNRIATKSRGMLSGSQTHARGQRQNEQDADLGILASVENASVGGFRKWLMDKTINILRERRNRRLADVITTPMRDTAAVAEHLERMRSARELAARYANAPPRQRGYAGRYGSIPAVTVPDQD